MARGRETMAVKKDNLKFKKKIKFLLKNHSGVAVLEMLPLLAVFVILFGLTFGFWASIHSGILRSIAARHYAFEVINNRSHIVYHRDTANQQPEKEQYYEKNGYRFFASVKRQQTDDPDLLSERQAINLFDSGGTQIPEQDRDDQANPIKLKTGYGICLNFECGGK